MERLTDTYNYYLTVADKRLENRFGMGGILSPIGTIAIYSILLITIRKFMENRKPYELKTFMLLYNIFQVVASFYNSFELIYLAIKMRYSLTCEPVNYSDEPLPTRMAYAMHFYYVLKVVDLTDTIVFALRKKTSQITFLHVFHHVSMILNSWAGIKWVPGGQSFLSCSLNSFIHGVMYSYYGLSSMGSAIQKYLWWKKYITQMQLIQFFCVIIHCYVNLQQTECTYPRGFSYGSIGYAFLLALLFLNFYRDLLAPFLFIIVVEYVTKQAEVGFSYLTHKGKQQHLTRKLRNSSTQIERKISDLDFAYDIALLENDPKKSEQQLSSYSENAKKVGL
ncbi:unnamed protein product, partial [Brachionus calyciflorus]